MALPTNTMARGSLPELVLAPVNRLMLVRSMPAMEK
jgi:hypothetical protein